MEDVIVRTAIETDLEILKSFEQGVIDAERPFDSTLKPGHINYYNLTDMISNDNVKIVIAEYNNKIIASGYARIEEAKRYLKHELHAYLGFMYVHPDYRGKGVNARIIDFLKKWAMSKNLTEMRLDVYYENEPAIKAYEKCGFNKHLIQMRLGL